MGYIRPLQEGNIEDLKREQAAAAAEAAKAEVPVAPPVEQEQPEQSEDRPRREGLDAVAAAVQKADPNLFQQAQDFIATNLLGQDQEDRDEARGRSEQVEEQIAQDDSLAAESGKAVFGAPKNLTTKVAGAVEFAGDVVGGVADAAGLIERDDTDIPWSDQYQYAQYDLGAAETQTVAGGIVQEALSFVLGGSITGGAARAAGAGRVAQAGISLGGDFVLDYFSDAEGGNLSNLIQSGPLANDLSAALAHQDEDNPHIRRLKNSIEGLIPGVGVEAVVGLYRGLRAGKAVQAAGGSAEEAAAAARKTAQETPSGRNAAAAAEENATVSGRPAEVVDLNDPELIRQTQEVMQDLEQLKAKIAKDAAKEAKSVQAQAAKDAAAAAKAPQTQLDIDFEKLSQLGQQDLNLEMVDYQESLRNVAKTLEDFTTRGEARAATEAKPPSILDDPKAGIDKKKVAKQVKELMAKQGPDPVATKAKVDSILRKVEGKPAKFEPQERAVQIDKADDINASAKSFWDDDMPGGGHSLVDEVDVQQIKTIEGLRSFVAERIPDVNVDGIARQLGRQTDDHMRDTFRSLAQFAIDGDIEDLTGRLSYDIPMDGGFKGQLPGNVVVLDTLSKSLGEKIGSLSKAIYELDAVDANFVKQGEQLLDRAEALILARKEASQVASKGLEWFKDLPPQLKEAVLKDRSQIKETIDEIRMNLLDGDPRQVLKARKQLKSLGLALMTTKGEPKAQMRVLEAMGRVAVDQFGKVQILGMLAQPLTHAKNIGGNVARISEHQLSRGFGGLFTDGMEPSDAAFAFQGFKETFAAAGRVGMDSLRSPVPLTTQGEKVTDYVLRDRKVLESLHKNATNKGERLTAQVYLHVFDAFNCPWFTWPGKALQVGDDFSKTLMAHMELRYEAGIETKKIAKDLGVTNPKEAAALADKRYAELVDKKIKPNGTILDNKLIDTVEAGAFQGEVSGSIGKVGKAIQKVPVAGKLVVPFYATPTKIIRYAGELSPLEVFSKEWSDTMKFGTQEQKAIMRGRMAMGSISSVGVGALAYNDLSTGYGPPPGPDRDLWLKDHQPHSFRVGTDKDGKPIWMSYQFIPGFSILWGTVSDTVQLAKNLEEGQAAHLLGAIPYFVANAITAQPVFAAFNAINGIFETIERGDGQNIVEGLAEIVNRTLGSPGIRRMFASSIAGGMHDYKNWVEKFVAQASFGITDAAGVTPSYPRRDILTGAQQQGKYGGNPLNYINPLTITGPEQSELVQTFRALQYPITDVVPLKVNGVKLNGEERAFLQDKIYADGKLLNSLKNVLDEDNSAFWNEYSAWQQRYEDGVAKPRKEAEWYKMINRKVQKYVEDARLELMYGQDPVSQNYRDTRQMRIEKPSNQPKDADEVKKLVEFSR